MWKVESFTITLCHSIMSSVTNCEMRIESEGLSYHPSDHAEQVYGDGEGWGYLIMWNVAFLFVIFAFLYLEVIKYLIFQIYVAELSLM